ncbi:hypothetical protein TELCIR_02837 [Teladorsagia circumcincta]|uniref:RDD family protein n=1 Tax=Teladorsagia circumcincta TaxID=45464 RepID=A0A2G9UY07_TELCI|nr:hypothetical protein TELCIR_02837 [Teladorsagia circumcincta]
MAENSSGVQKGFSCSEKDQDGVHSPLQQYCDELRKWMSEVTCWQAFHQYNMAVMAYQDRMRTWQAYSSTGTLLHRRRDSALMLIRVRLATERFGNVEPNEPNAEDRRARDLLLPVPASARDVAVIHNPNGPDLLAAQFQDLSRFDKLLGNEADLQTLVDVTQELFPLELLGKLACSLLEALCLSQSLFPRFFGQTPGKYIMRVRVIECGSVSHVAGAPPNVVRVTGVLSVPFKAAVLRSMLKNILINSLVPFSTVAFAFNHNRAIYDILARTISASAPINLLIQERAWLEEAKLEPTTSDRIRGVKAVDNEIVDSELTATKENR